MSTNELPDFDKLWDYQKAGETEAKFRSILPLADQSGNQEYRLQLGTQIARTLSLQAKFDEAHAELDLIERAVGDATPVAEIRYLLERGRTFNSAKKIPQAMPLFLHAYLVATMRGLDALAVDAAHMVAAAEKDPAQQMEWNLKALAIAERSADPKARGWIASLTNNIGWTLHGQGKFEEALAMFEKALALRIEKGDAYSIHVARWCVARTLRSLGRFAEALAIQKALKAALEAAGESDQYVDEELAELARAAQVQ